MSEIKKGDMVYIARPHCAQAPDVTVGTLFIAGPIFHTDAGCHHCGRITFNARVVELPGTDSVIDVDRLKKIEPPAASIDPRAEQELATH